METSRQDGPALRVNIDPENAGAGLGRLVLVLLDVVRQLLERQALRRVDEGGLTPEQAERLGQGLLALDRRFAELREVFRESETGSSLRTVEPADLPEAVNRPAVEGNTTSNLDGRWLRANRWMGRDA